jgi:hypothetical protein
MAKPVYFSRPASPTLSEWEDPTRGDTITVHETQREPVKTGLLDKDGCEIMRAPDECVVGFVHHSASESRPTPSPPGRRGWGR